MIGKTLGPFRIVEKIGEGGMGVVYRAVDERLNRDVALKVLPGTSVADDASRARFRKEALALARLNHPNIAIVHEFDSQGGVDFLVMELVSGIPLSQKLSAGPLPEAEVVRLGAQAADALAAAHVGGVVHRDLKPSNLLITAEGRLKILDFGIAKLLEPAHSNVAGWKTELAPWMPGADAPPKAAHAQPGAMETRITIPYVARGVQASAEAGTVVHMAGAVEASTTSGTIPYMAPEQLRGEAADERTDIWALGVVLYEMASGALPFHGRTSFEITAGILREPPVPLPPQVSPGLNAVIQRCLQKDPKRRYQKASEVRPALEGAAKPVPVAAEKPERRIRWRGLAAGAALAVLVALLLVWNIFGGRERGLSGTSSRQFAVLGFKNLSGREDAAWLSTTLSDTFTSELAKGRELRTVPGETITQAHISLPDVGSFGKDTLVRIRDSLGADYVLYGSYLSLGGKLRVDVMVQDSASGELIHSISGEGTESELLDLIGSAGTSARTRLEEHIRSATAEQRRAARVKGVGDKFNQLVGMFAKILPGKPAGPSGGTAPGAPAPSAPAGPSLAEQQQQLQTQANSLAGKGNYADAIQLVDKALALNGPLNPDLTKLKDQLQRGEQNAKLWAEEKNVFDQGKAAYDQSKLDQAEKSFKQVVGMKGGQRQSEAQRYLSELIPARKQEEKYMADAKGLVSSNNAADLQKAQGLLSTVSKGSGPRKGEAEGLLKQVDAKLVLLGKEEKYMADAKALVNSNNPAEDRKSTRLNSSHPSRSRMPSSA